MTAPLIPTQDQRAPDLFKAVINKHIAIPASQRREKKGGDGFRYDRGGKMRLTIVPPTRGPFKGR